MQSQSVDCAGNIAISNSTNGQKYYYKAAVLLANNMNYPVNVCYLITTAWSKTHFYFIYLIVWAKMLFVFVGIIKLLYDYMILWSHKSADGK